MNKLYKLSKTVEFMMEDGYLNIPTFSLIFTRKYTTTVSLEFRKWISIGVYVDNFTTIKDNQFGLIMPFSVFAITWWKTEKQV